MKLLGFFYKAINQLFFLSYLSTGRSKLIFLQREVCVNFFLISLPHSLNTCTRLCTNGGTCMSCGDFPLFTKCFSEVVGSPPPATPCVQPLCVVDPHTPHTPHTHPVGNPLPATPCVRPPCVVHPPHPVGSPIPATPCVRKLFLLFKGEL